MLDNRAAWVERTLEHSVRYSMRRFGESWQQLIDDIRSRPRPRRQQTTRQSWLLFAGAASSRGEAGLAAQLLPAVHECGHQLQVVTCGADNAALLQGPWPLLVDPGPGQIAAPLASGPDRIVFANSFHWRAILPQLERHVPGAPAVALETTWPEWLAGLDKNETIGLVVCALPEALYRRGLSGDTPLFHLPPKLRKRVRCGVEVSIGTPEQTTDGIDVEVSLDGRGRFACPMARLHVIAQCHPLPVVPQQQDAWHECWWPARLLHVDPTRAYMARVPFPFVGHSAPFGQLVGVRCWPDPARRTRPVP